MHGLAHGFASLAGRRGHAPLIVTERGPHTASDVDARALSEERRLRERVRPGALVGLQAGNGVGFLAGLIAVLRSESPVLLVDAHQTAAERATIAAALGVGSWLRETRSGFVIEDASPAAAAADLGPTSVVKLTSGSSGTPRGVAVTSDNLLADDAALTATMALVASDRLLTTVPFSHSYGLSSLVLPALLRGTTLLVSESAGAWGALRLADEAGGSVLFTVPTFLDSLLRHPGQPPLPASIRLVVSAGAPLAPEIGARFRERFGLPVHAFYGASECGGICYDRVGGACERASVGTPVDRVQVELDPDGRVIVRSAAVGQGYLPEADDRLREGRFVTEDLAAWRDGELALQGRVGRRINVRGYKVDPGEIERVIAALPAVQEVHVLEVRDARAQPLVRAVIACRAGTLSTGEVLDWCRERLAAHKVPRSIALVPCIPRTSRGKVDHTWLAGPLDG